LCDLSQLPPGCIIYSVGSSGDFSFEQAVLKRTKCSVHTFDCTYSGVVQPGYDLDPARFTYHKWCLGRPKVNGREGASETNYKPVEGGEYLEYAEVVSRLNHSRVDVLKIDIEGMEYAVLGDAFHESTPSLPRQISIELHFSHHDTVDNTPYSPNIKAAKSLPHMALFFAHMANLGYGALAYKGNGYMDLGCCADYSFLRVEGFVSRKREPKDNGGNELV